MNPPTSRISTILTNAPLSIMDLKGYIRVKFTGCKEAGVCAGISASRVKQILTGYHIPKSAKIINRIAHGWGIDPVNLSLIFKNEEEKIKSNETK